MGSDEGLKRMKHNTQPDQFPEVVKLCPKCGEKITTNGILKDKWGRADPRREGQLSVVESAALNLRDVRHQSAPASAAAASQKAGRSGRGAIAALRETAITLGGSMSVPKSVKIGGFLWTIREAQALPSDPNPDPYNGECNLDLQLISIDPLLTSQHKRQVLLHEILHAIVWQSGLGDATGWLTDEQAENLVTVLSHSLYQVLRDNPQLQWDG